MKDNALTTSTQQLMYASAILLPGMAIAGSATSSTQMIYAFCYGAAMALVGYLIAVKQVFSKNVALNISLLLAASFCLPGMVFAATTGGEFQPFYDFIYGAATGYLGRGLAITGGVFGLAYGIGKGSPLPAVLGIVLAIFGMLGPTIINALFSSATI